jgi:hypothetical protein
MRQGTRQLATLRELFNRFTQFKSLEIWFHTFQRFRLSILLDIVRLPFITGLGLFQTLQSFDRSAPFKPFGENTVFKNFQGY